MRLLYKGRALDFTQYPKGYQERGICISGKFRILVGVFWGEMGYFELFATSPIGRV